VAATFKEKAVSGVKWSAISQFGTQVVVMAGSVILARLLSPGDFGLMALLTVLAGFAGYFANFGFSTALIQQKEVTDAELSSVFWVNVLAGIILFFLFFLGAPRLAVFFKEPIIEPLTKVISVNFLLSSLSFIHYTLLNRRLAFKELAIVTFGAVVISYAGAIILAYKGFGVWSLLIQSLLSALALSVGYFYFSRWRPQFIFSKKSLHGLSKVGFQVFIISILDYVALNIDTLLIGKFINKRQLGEYGRSNAFLMLPVVNVTAVISRVILPSLAHIQDDKPRVAAIYFQAARFIAAITFPMMIGLAVVAHPFVLVIFGEQWLGMVPMLQCFSVLGILASLNSLHDPVIVSQGRTDLLFRLAPFEKGLLILAIFGGLYWGVFGIIICKMVANFILVIPKVWIVGKAIEKRVGNIYANVSPFLIMALSMGVVVFFAGKIMPPHLGVAVLLGAQVVSGIVSYGLFILILRPKVLTELRSIMR
jgi:O-antigen/teichoic acid export membrane protein